MSQYNGLAPPVVATCCSMREGGVKGNMDPNFMLMRCVLHTGNRGPPGCTAAYRKTFGDGTKEFYVTASAATVFSKLLEFRRSPSTVAEWELWVPRASKTNDTDGPQGDTSDGPQGSGRRPGSPLVSDGGAYGALLNSWTKLTVFHFTKAECRLCDFVTRGR